MGIHYLKSSAAATTSQNPLTLLKRKSSAAAATWVQNSGRCHYLQSINSKKNDGIQIRYLLMKFQLYLRKLQFNLLEYRTGYSQHLLA